MSTITSHVLDTSLGRPAVGIAIRLDRASPDAEAASGWQPIGESFTNDDGRATDLTDDELQPGTYRLTFDTGAYFAALGANTFYPRVEIVFEIGEAAEHYHVPLLLSPHGYSTYRGS